MSAEVAAAAPPQAPSPPPGPKKRVIRVRRKATPTNSKPDALGEDLPLPESAFPPAPQGVTTASAVQVQKELLGDTLPQKLPSFDILGDVGEYEARLEEYKQIHDPPQPKGPQVDVNELAPELQEAVRLAPDGGTALLETYESIAAERSSLLQQLNTLREKQDIEVTRKHSASTTAPLLSPRKGEDGTTKWNAGPPLYQVLEHEVEQTQFSSLARHAQIKRDWDRQRGLLTKMTGRRPEELVMEREQEYREKLQELHHLHMAIPLEDRHGSNQWTMSLRNNWTRYVPVGNVFSGLFCPVEENPGTGEVEYIAKPTTCEVPTDTLRTSLGRGRNWLQSETLSERKKRYGRRMKSISSHAPDFEGFEVLGAGVEHTLEETALQEISLEEVERRLKEENQAAWEQLEEARARHARKEEEAARAAEEAREKAEAEQRAKEPVQGPYIELAAERLHLAGPVRETARQVLRVINTGSTALYYKWERKPPPVALTCQTGADGPSRFYLGDMSGAMLPGEVKEFVFGFKSDVPGMYTDEWQLSTLPHTPFSIPQLSLRGIATTEDQHRLQRRNMDTELAEREKMSAVANAIDRILGLVEVPDRPRIVYPLEGDECDREAKWLRSNQEADPAVYYSADAYAALEKVFDQCQELLKPPEPEEEEVEDPKAKAPPKKGAPPEEDEAPPPPPPPPPVWGGGIPEIEALLAEVAAGPNAEAGAALSDEVARVAVAARRPAVQHRFHKHAMFSALGDLADAVEARAESLKEQLIAEAEAAKAAAAEAAARAAAEGEEEEEEEEEATEEDDLEKMADEAGGGKKRGGRRGAAASAAAAAAEPPPPSAEEEDDDDYDEEIDGPRPPNYDVEQFRALLTSSAHATFGATVDAFNTGVRAEKGAVGSQLQAHIGEAYAGLEAGAEGDAAVALRWRVFDLERWKVALDVEDAPPAGGPPPKLEPAGEQP